MFLKLKEKVLFGNIFCITFSKTKKIKTSKKLFCGFSKENFF